MFLARRRDAVDAAATQQGSTGSDSMWFTCCQQSAFHFFCLRCCLRCCHQVGCPVCIGERREHVNVVWFERLCRINGVQWPVEAVQRQDVDCTCHHVSRSCAHWHTSWQPAMLGCPLSETAPPPTDVTHLVNVRTSHTSVALCLLWCPTPSWTCIQTLNRLSQVRPVSLKVGQLS